MKLKEKGFKQVILVGGDFSKVEHPYQYFTDAESALAWIKSQEIHDTLLLIKGSRSTKMEKLMEAF